MKTQTPLMNQPACRWLTLILLLLGLNVIADPIRVAVYKDKGAGRSVSDLMKALALEPDLKVSTVTAEDIRGGALSRYDVVIHPGGSGGGQGRQLGEKGREDVRDFVRKGGGYLGICAGAYLASNDYAWSLNLIDAKVIDKQHWARGTGTVQLDLSKEGQKLLGASTNIVEVYYGQGPLLLPKEDPEVNDYQQLATYKTEIAKKGAPKGVMPGTTAVATSTFGEGRVFCFSPHPEKTEGLEPWINHAVRWLTKTPSDE